MRLESFTQVDAMNAADEIIGRPLALGLGDQPAVLSGDRSVTYSELNALTNRNGNALLAHGVDRGDRVLILMDDSPELIAAYLGAMRVGAVSVALNVRLAARDVLYVIQDSGCRVLYVDAQFFNLYEEIRDQIDNPPLVVTNGGPAHPDCKPLEVFLEGRSDQLESVAMSPDDVGFWLYSSGTTGRPKAVMHMHKAVLRADELERTYLGLRPGERVFTTSKMFFGFALGHSLMGGLQAGATVIVSPGWPDAATIIDTVERHQPDLMFSTPVMYRNLLREGAPDRPAFQRIRHFVSAGEKLPDTLFEQWRARAGKPMLDGPGASETIFLFLFNHPDDPKPSSSGKPVPWAEVRLMSETGEEITTPGMPGAIAIRMSAQFCGYWNQPELTQKALRDGWYYPGDMFEFDEEGRWYYHGRMDDMLKISGQWVSPTEIEAVAATAPGIAEAAVIGVTNEDGLVRLAMFAVPKDLGANQAELEAGLMATLKASLSIYKCPRTIRFIDEMPRTATGKMQKFRLRQLMEQSA